MTNDQFVAYVIGWCEAFRTSGTDPDSNAVDALYDKALEVPPAMPASVSDIELRKWVQDITRELALLKHEVTHLTVERDAQTYAKWKANGIDVGDDPIPAWKRKQAAAEGILNGSIKPDYTLGASNLGEGKSAWIDWGTGEEKPS